MQVYLYSKTINYLFNLYTRKWNKNRIVEKIVFYGFNCFLLQSINF